MTRSVNELNADLFDGEDDQRATDPKAARKKAMDFLARREYGRDELIGRLKSAGFAVDTASEAVDALTAEGLQDDGRFAENFIQARIGRGSGPLRIRQALLERGLDGGLVDHALAALDTDWCGRARLVREKKYGAPLPREYKEKARQMRFLQYRGFDTDQIRAAMQDDLD